MKRNDGRYMASTACSVANVEPPTLRAWRRFGWFAPHVEKSGKEWTLYSFVDLCVLRCASVLIGQGIAGNIAVPVAEKLRPLLDLNEGRFHLVAVFYPPHRAKGAIPTDDIRVKGLRDGTSVLMLYPDDEEGRAAIVVDLLGVEGHVLQTLADLGWPSVATSSETRSIIAEAMAKVLDPGPDEPKESDDDR